MEDSIPEHILPSDRLQTGMPVDRPRSARTRFIRRTIVHVAVFASSFLITAGAFMVFALVWIRPESYRVLVLTSVLCGVMFVSLFASLRMYVLHRMLNEYPDREEDPGSEYHWSKSIVYGFVALVVALLLAGFLVSIASAHPRFSIVLDKHSMSY